VKRAKELLAKAWAQGWAFSAPQSMACTRVLACGTEWSRGATEGAFQGYL